MENANPPPSNHPILPAVLRAQAVQELHELLRISAFVDSRLESIERFLNNFTNQPNETNMNDLESDDELVDTPLVSPFPHSDNDSDDGEILNELIEYENAGTLRRERIINSFNGVDMAFQCMIGFRKFTAYLDPFLPMNIISHNNTTTVYNKNTYNYNQKQQLGGHAKNTNRCRVTQPQPNSQLQPAQPAIASKHSRRTTTIKAPVAVIWHVHNLLGCHTYLPIFVCN
nr:hypothetical protein [Tanacetum cinerariifolium]